MPDGRFISYIRVSTARQGQSGLGLEAQRSAVTAWLNGGNYELVDEYVEVETGTAKRHRPKLAEAIQTAKRSKATLVIAKLDRLARNVAFVSNLMESGVDFIACDMPTANRLTIHLLAAMAEHEAEQISARTKAALAAAKAQGRLLGSANPRIRKAAEPALKAAAASHKVNADMRALDLIPIIEGVQQAGVSTLSGIAEALNNRGVTTARGGRWHPTTVRNILNRTIQPFRR